MSNLVDEKYYQQVSDESLTQRLLIAARDRICREFVRQMQPAPSDRILDVGVSDVISKGANMLEHCYPAQQSITACGLGAGQEFQATFPKVKYIQIKPNVRL